jgi:AhpD family alkylhydroperoxidase
VSRIQPLPYEQWDDDFKKFARGDAASDYDKATLGIMAKSPKAVKAMFAFQGAMKSASTMSPRMRELIRLRVAFHNQCRSCMAVRYQGAVDDGVTEGLVCSLEKPQDAPDLTPAEKAALAYADLAATDHFSIDDSTFDRLREHFSESQIIELGLHVASCIGFGRFAASLHMVDALPEAYKQDSGKIAPWTHEPMVVPG